jgi:hypothetical protein
VEGSDCRLRGAIAGGGERPKVEGSDRRLREAFAGGEEAFAGGGERLQVEGSNCFCGRRRNAKCDANFMIQKAELLRFHCLPFPSNKFGKEIVH